jgi:ferritin-like metal-binding protein YciE
MESAREFFAHELSDMLDAERKILEIIEEAQGDVQNEQFRKALEQHYKQTKGQINRLEQCFQELDEEPQEAECKGIEGLRQERESFMQEEPSEELLQMFTVGATTKVEHYEIAAYNSLVDLGTKLGLKKGVRLLQQNLREEEQMLKKAEGIAKKLKPSITGFEQEEEEEEAAPSRGRSRSSRGRRAA